MSEPVLFGRGRSSFRELSNFHVSPIVIDGREYATVEHYFQACKAQDDASHEAIRQAPTPKQARAMGRALPDIRPDWESRKIGVMRWALMAISASTPSCVRSCSRPEIARSTRTPPTMPSGAG